MGIRPGQAKGAYTGDNGGGGGGGSVNSVSGQFPIVSSGGTDPIVSFAGISAPGTAGQSIRMNAGATAFEYYTPATGTVTGVTAVSPVVSSGGAAPQISLIGISGLGSALQAMAVNAAGTALEWVSSTGTSTFVRSVAPTLTGRTFLGSGQGTSDYGVLVHGRAVINPAGVTGGDIADSTSVALQINAQASATFNFRVASNTGTAQGIWDMGKSRGTLASAAYVNSGDEMGRLRWLGYQPGGTAYQVGYIGSFATQTHTGTNRGFAFTFNGNGTNSSTTAEWMRLIDGALLVGTTSLASGDIFRAGAIIRTSGTALGIFGATPVTQRTLTTTTAPNPVLDTAASIAFQQSIVDGLRSYGLFA